MKRVDHIYYMPFYLFWIFMQQELHLKKSGKSMEEDGMELESALKRQS